MRQRVIITVLLALVLGFVTSWAVAWGQVVLNALGLTRKFYSFSSATMSISSAGDARYVLEGPNGWGWGTHFLAYEASASDQFPERPARWVCPLPTEGYYMMCYWSFGWPRRCVTYHFFGDAPWASVSKGTGFHQAIIVPSDTPLIGKAIFPTRIYWPGMLANTGLYGAAWFVLLLMPFSIRSVRRRMRRRCVGCGYDVSASPDQCPECGRVVKRRGGSHRLEACATEEG